MNSALSLHPKTTGAALSGSLGWFVTFLLSRLHVTVTPDETAAICVALAAFGSWLAPLVKAETARLEAAPAVTFVPPAASGGTSITVTSPAVQASVAPVIAKAVKATTSKAAPKA